MNNLEYQKLIPLDKKTESPEVNAGFLSKVFYCWLNSFFRIGVNRDLTVDDIYPVISEIEASYLEEIISVKWTNEIKQTQHEKNPGKTLKLFKCILQIFGPTYFLCILAQILGECVIKVSLPIFLSYLINYFNQGVNNRGSNGIIFGGAIILGSFINILLENFQAKILSRLGMGIRISISCLMYKKALRLSHQSLEKITAGKVTNLFANDLSRLEDILHLHPVIIAGIQVPIVTWILWHYFGPYSLCGFPTLFIFVGIQGAFGRMLSKLRLKTIGETDARLRLLNEILVGIRTIKMYAWEIPLSKMVNKIRMRELEYLSKMQRIRAFNVGLHFAYIIFIVSIFFAYFLDGNFLNSERIFVCLALFEVTRSTVAFNLPNSISAWADFLNSLKRAQEFLLMDEVAEKPPLVPALYQGDDQDEKEAPKITIKDLNVLFENEMILEKINMQIQEPGLYAICGPVGSGKSTLLAAILGQVPFEVSGSLDTNGSIAYYPQEPWIFGGSVRENILFGKTFSSDWYSEVVDACSLRSDFNTFPAGDSTIVGERGTRLSGGQKSRIALARAVYTRSDIYLLDDPFSSVDAKVSTHIFQRCINRLLRSKIVILVTHQHQLLNSAKCVYCLEKGQIIAEGSPADLTGTSGEGASHVVLDSIVESDRAPSPEERPRLRSRSSCSDEKNIVLLDEIDENTQEDDKENIKMAKIADTYAYVTYFKAGATCLSLSFFFFFNVGTQVFWSGSEYFLKFWAKTNEYQEQHKADNVSTSQENDLIDILKYDKGAQIGFYLGLIISLIIFATLGSLLFFQICRSASRELHNRMLMRLLKAPIQFFNNHPSGRVLNRFSKDTNIMDDELSRTISSTFQAALRGVSTVIIISIITPVILVPAVALVFVIVFIRRIYVKTYKRLQVLEANARSPLLSHLNSSLDGMATIRASQNEDLFTKQYFQLLNTHSGIVDLNYSTRYWARIWLDFISVSFTAAVIISIIYISDHGVGGAEAGLVVSSAMSLGGIFQFGIRQSAIIETMMISIKRILSYTEMESEFDWDSMPYNKPNVGWPTDGAIMFKNISLEYDTEVQVLKNISMEIKPGEKVGIIGRTGAGKSSLIAALFRLPEPCAGEIEIDGVNILRIGLHDLRTQLSIIPQQPVLFQGELRQNLDPLDKFSDNELWSSLLSVQFYQSMEESGAGLEFQKSQYPIYQRKYQYSKLMESKSIPNKGKLIAFVLFAKVQENGSNLSLGQRQLICLARAILRRNKIIVLDEATANVDLVTDALVQKVVREAFAQCTVLTVAHRLSTVIDYDKIIVMDNGEITEFDIPHKLLQNPSSALSQLVEQTGKEMSTSLRKLAKLEL